MENPFSEEQSVPTHDTLPVPQQHPTTAPLTPGQHPTELATGEDQQSEGGHQTPVNHFEEQPAPVQSDVAEAQRHLSYQTEANSHEEDTSTQSAQNDDSESAGSEGLIVAGQEPEPGSLEDFAQRSRRARLQTEEEAETVRLLKETLLGGRSEVARAIAVTPLLPWVVSVQATTLAWPEMKPSFRAQFLAGMARTQGEAAARVRLSLARGLYKVDPAAAIKLILLTLKVMRNKETGFLEGKGASIFTGVLIGRGKAWVLQLPLQDMKPAEADLLVFSALHSAFHAPQAPITQLGILRWAADRLEKLSPALEALILKGLTRWSGKWQTALRKEVPSLPQSWTDTLKVPAPKENTNSKRENQEARQGELEELEKEPISSEAADGSGIDSPEESNHENKRDEEENGDDEENHRDSDQDEEDSEDESERRERNKQRPVYVSKTVPNHGTQTTHSQQGRRGASTAHFNLTDSLRQIENHVAHLRSELHTAQKQLRQREDDTRRGRRNEKPLPQPNPGEFSNDELNRLNQQLELRNAELKTRIDELTLDSEERATSRGLVTDSQAPDPNTQLQILLGWKLKDDFDDFLALQQESRDLVVQQHYKTLLGHVFEVLQAEGIQFENSEPRQ